MKIEILYFEGCPTYKKAHGVVNQALEKLNKKAEVNFVKVTEDTAEELRFIGSPTVRINGNDIDPKARNLTDFGIRCRIYHTSKGLKGWPDAKIIENTIKNLS